MKEYRERLEARRMIFIGLNILVIMGLGAIAVLSLSSAFSGVGGKNGVITGIRVGLSVGMEIVFLKKTIMIVYALKDEKQLRKLYIEEHDERNKLVFQQTGSFGFDIALMGLLIAMVVASFFNMLICLTLLGVILFLSTIKISLRIYYQKKY